MDDRVILKRIDFPNHGLIFHANQEMMVYSLFIAQFTADLRSINYPKLQVKLNTKELDEGCGQCLPVKSNLPDKLADRVAVIGICGFAQVKFHVHFKILVDLISAIEFGSLIFIRPLVAIPIFNHPSYREAAL